MKLHFAQWKSLFFAGLAVGFFPLMQSQSAAQGQMIVFSSPDGQITTNAPLPIAQVPQPSEPLADLPGEAPQGLFKPPTPNAPYVPLMSGPVYQQDNFQPRDDFQNPMDLRRRMGAQASAQIMGVPSVEQIFGLPERDTADGKKNPLLDPMQSEYGINGATNMMSADRIEASSWAKLLSDNSNPGGDGTTSSNSTDKTSGLFSGFFDSTPKKSVKDSLFGGHDDQADDTGFGSSPASAQQSTWDTFLNGTPAPATAESSQNFSTPNLSSSPGLNSQSPFNQLPQSSGFNTLPQVPTPPAAPGQNYNSMQPATPSWEPKPPPWLSSTPAMGTMPQRKF
jgi:hypothetical protein